MCEVILGTQVLNICSNIMQKVFEKKNAVKNC